jgi:hypothetical protein
MKLTPARIVALLYGVVVLALLSLSLWPQSYGVGRLLAVVFSLPWGLIAMFVLDIADQDLIVTLGPPLLALGGFLNAYLVYNALRGRSE